jgi:alkylation response protein AidB-like acyl-CoA dehydrogenase
MDFELDDDLQEVRSLAEQIFTDKATAERVRYVETEHAGHDATLWHTLAESGLIGVALPETVGGAGMGLLGLVAVLEQQGRWVAPVPLWAVVTTGAMPIADFGSDAQKKQWLSGIVEGTTVVTGAFDSALGHEAPAKAEPYEDGWRVSGALVAVTGGGVAQAVVVPVATPQGTVVAVVPTDRPGVTITPVAVTNRECSANILLEDVRVFRDDVLPADGDQIVDWVRTRARIALSALSAGVCEEAVTITAAYTSERLQFGRPLSTNQAVLLRAADAYLDAERIRLTTYKAAWLVDRGEEDAARVASLVAKWWASRGGLRAVLATQHLHGGIGADTDYPIHRYFLWGRQIAFSLGSAGAVEAELGDILDNVTPIGAPA